MVNLSQVLQKFGFTRDDATWVWAQAVGFAALIAANLTNLPAWAVYVGVHLSDLQVHRISAVAAVILYLGGRYGSSTLPGLVKEAK